MDAKPGPQPDAHPDPSDAYPIPDRPVYDPEPIPNIVLHPGDAVAVDPFGHGHYEYRLFDRARAHYATLVGHHDDDGHFVVDTILFVGRGVLPVRPEPEPDALGHPLTVSHAHPHPHRTGDNRGFAHDHPHSHAGARALSVALYGHADDPHDDHPATDPQPAA